MAREPLRETIRRQLTERIVAGDMVSGERIKLADTAGAIGVSMTPLREALVQLELDGFVVSDPGCGYSVAALTAAEVEEIYPLVWTLERLALELAPPPRRTWSRLEEVNRRFRAAEDPDEARRLDNLWHAELLRGCWNRTLSGFLDVLKRRAARYELAFMRQRQRAGSPSSADQHDAVVAALRRHDLESAGEILEENWRLGPATLLPWLASRAVRRDGGG